MYKITIQFDCTKEQLSWYKTNETKTIGDIRKRIIELFEDDYENVKCQIKAIENEHSISNQE